VAIYFLKMTSDSDLLQQFARENSQDAFSEIVRRHVNLVYSAALRQVRSPQLAEDVAQSVFADLARDARRLRPDTVLTAWLYAVARRTAIDTVRKESRRQLREQLAMEMNDMNATADDWAQIAPLLDDAMAAMDETDRAAILLRYFENKSLREVGESLKISDDAAQKRVSRAVDCLREFFTSKKVAMGAGALAALISANAVQSAPVGLVAAVLTATLAGTPVLVTPILHKVVIAGMSAVAVGTVIYAIHLQGQVGSLEQRESSLTDQIAQLERERGGIQNQLTDLQQQNDQLQAGKTELLRLRGEVTRLRNGLNVPAAAVAPVETKNPDPVRIQLHTKARFISIPAEDVSDLGIEWLPGAGGGGRTGLLNKSQFKTILKALQEASDVEIIGEPEVVTLYGRQTQMRITRPVSVHGTQVDIGEVLDSISSFSTNSSTFEMNLGASLTLLAGDPAQPDFQTIEMTNHVSVSPAQTAVLETEIPAGAWLADFTNASPEARSLLVFVTPSAIDAAGNLVDPNTGKPQ
jgi:RNA polymerase sigma factor (sigma-70 family)